MRTESKVRHSVNISVVEYFRAISTNVDAKEKIELLLQALHDFAKSTKNKKKHKEMAFAFSFHETVAGMIKAGVVSQPKR